MPQPLWELTLWLIAAGPITALAWFLDHLFGYDQDRRWISPVAAVVAVLFLLVGLPRACNQQA